MLSYLVLRRRIAFRSLFAILLAFRCKVVADRVSLKAPC